MTWQKMKTAPKDGSAVLVLLHDGDIAYPARFRDGWMMAWDDYALNPISDGPTHWMPIPPRPEGTK